MARPVFDPVLVTTPYVARIDSLERTRSLEPLNVKDAIGAYAGAVGDGVADDSAALARAYATGRPLYVPPGTYRVLSTPFVGSTPLRIFGDGPGATIFVTAGCNLATISGSISAAQLLTASVVAGATSLSIASTAGYAAGDDLIIRDTGQVLPGTAASPYAGVVGEVQRIKSVDSGTSVTVWGALEQAMPLTAGNLSARKITPVGGVLIAAMTIRNANPSTYLGGNARALQLTACRDVDAVNVRFERLDDDAVNLQSCVDWRVLNCHFEDLQNTGSRTPYGVCANNACVNGLVQGCRQNAGRHLFTTGGDNGEIGPAHIMVALNQAWGSTSNPFDTHPAGREITLAFNQDHACTGGGVHLRTPRSRVVGHKTFGVAAAAGITLGGTATGSTVEDCEVRGVTTCIDVQAEDCDVRRIKGEGSAYVVRVRGLVDLVGAAITKARVRDIQVIGNPSVGGVVGNGTDTTTRVFERIYAPDATTPVSPARAVDLEGTGTPEGVITAGIGSTFRRRNGGAGTSFYVKESGTGNTGWTAK